MERHSYCLTWLLFISFAFISLFATCQGAIHDDRKAYVVYMGDRPQGEFSPSAFHTDILQEALGSGASDNLLHSYHRSFNGFVAKLNKDEVQKLAGMNGVVSVFPNERKQLHTTRSWDFMGFSEQVSTSIEESDIIIGMLDTGIWPESESFSDEGFGPPPTKWRGTCQESSNFACNNKIIGARFYRKEGNLPAEDILSPRDTEGHGTHTTSTAAGNIVNKATLFGLGSGTARGGVPSARIAMYKICWSDGCYDSDILAAFDDAIADGVDIISISVGGFFAKDYFNDSIAIGAFHAMKNGILTSNSAGNSGPGAATITNVSPWSLSVAASTIDRKFVTKVQLGNGNIFEGVSVNTFNLKNKKFPVIYGGFAPNRTGGFNESQSRLCLDNSLNKKQVKGKIVFCDDVSRGEAAVNSDAVGTIMKTGQLRDAAFPFPLPASILGLDDASSVFNYLSSTSKPRATIRKSKEAKDDLAPFVVSFSSRGPNPITSDILKPDLTAPGVDILAAWSQGSTVTRILGDKRVVPFNIISGTSMSCPHATAAAAYVKSFHPTWSPSAIKSALMTTAFAMASESNTDAEFAYGAGHLNPSNAIDPGLIYDANEIDYVNFLCGQGYSTQTLRIVTGDASTCSEATKKAVTDLNYPSFALSTTTQKHVTRTFHRTVTNVGSSTSTYKAIVNTPPGIEVQVKPIILSFSSYGEKKSFRVKINAQMDQTMYSGSLVWDDGLHQVRSPIVAYLISS